MRRAKRAVPKGARQHGEAERMWFPVNERLEPVFRVPLLRVYAGPADAPAACAGTQAAGVPSSGAHHHCPELDR